MNNRWRLAVLALVIIGLCIWLLRESPAVELAENGRTLRRANASMDDAETPVSDRDSGPEDRTKKKRQKTDAGPDLRPPKASEFYGKVTTPNGSPVAGAVVRWIPIAAPKALTLTGKTQFMLEPPLIPAWTSDELRVAMEGSRVVLTDADGVWSMPELSPAIGVEFDGDGTLLIAAHPIHGLSVKTAFERKAGGRHEHKIQMGGRGRVSGKVVSRETGEPAAGMDVAAWNTSGIVPFSRGRGWRTPVEADGTYSFDGLPAATYLLLPVPGRSQYVAPRHSEALEVTVTQNEPQTGLDFRVNSGATLTVVARNATGKTLRASVVAAHKAGQRSYQVLADRDARLTREDGRVRLGPLVPGDHGLGISADGYEWKERAVEGLVAGENRQIDVVLTEESTGPRPDPPNQALENQGQDGTPQPEGTLTVEVTSDGRVPDVPVRVAVGTDIDLIFGFKEAPAGRTEFSVGPQTGLMVVALAAGFAPTVSEPVTIEEGETSHVAIGMSQGVSIAGEVVNEEGEPVPGVTVLSIRSDKYRDYPPHMTHPMDARTNTDSGGRFSLKRLAAGNYLVALSVDLPAPPPVRIKAPTTNVVLVVPAVGHSVVGRATANGLPIPGATVLTSGDCPNLKTQTDDQGDYRIDDLPAERCTVGILGANLDFSAEKVIQIGPKEETRVDFAFSGVSVTVNVPDGGLVPTSATVLPLGVAMPAAGSEAPSPASKPASKIVAQAFGTPRGRVIIQFVPPGSYDLYLQYGWTGEPTRQRIEVGTSPIEIEPVSKGAP